MRLTKRDVIAIVLVIWMALAAFVAGYMFHDYRQSFAAAPVAAVDDEQFSVFWEALGWVEQSFIGDVPDDRAITYGAIRGALATLNDPYTYFVEPVAREQERETLRGNFGGIGANIRREEDGRLTLTPIPGNPAEAAGIRDGDTLLAVDGLDVSDPDAFTVEEIVQLIRGEKGTAVVLTVRHAGSDAPVDIAIVRADILIPSVTARILPEDPTIGYIQLTRFSGESGGEVSAAIARLQAEGATRLILDLRHNGGGLLDGAIAVSDHFVEGGVLLYQQSRGQAERQFEANGAAAAGAMPLVVLIDGGTASAAEIVAGALRDRERAVLIGAPTFGKGSVQLVYDLSDGSSVHVTAARWFTPARHQIDQQGLAPDILVETTAAAAADGRDEFLARAVAFLQNGE
jgi:carboxyl-terminal processing protease